MSVRRHLGLDGPLDSGEPVSGPPGEARRRWPVWRAEYPVLGVVTDAVELRAWLGAADPADADEVLAALAWWAAPGGGDDVAAAGLLAWLLVPAACRIASRLQGMSPRIDEVVACELWLQARTVGQLPGRRRVAANIALNTRREVVARLGHGGGATWGRTDLVDPAVLGWRDFEAADEGSSVAATGATVDRVAAVLRRAVGCSAITEADRELLLAAAAAACDLQLPLRAGGGMTTPTVAEVVGPQFGVSARVARRRVVRALRVLREMAAVTGALTGADLSEKVPA